MAIKEKDFIQVSYTGKLKEDNTVFDTTDKALAEKEGIYQEGMPYGEIIICVGQGRLVAGLENALIGKEIGKDYTVELGPEEAFGKKSAKLLKLVPTNAFRKQQINPMPGLQVEIDNQMGTIKTVTGGRTIVDFNHPLSGKEIIYEIKVSKEITDDAEKVKAYFQMLLGIKDIDVKLDNGTAKITMPNEVPEEVAKNLTETIKEVIPAVKKLEFVKKAEQQEVAPKEA